MNDKFIYVAQVKYFLTFHTILGNYILLTVDKLACHNALIILFFCCLTSPAYDSGGTELNIFDTQGTLDN